MLPLSPSSRRQAFTLVELLVVIAIIGVLVSLLLPAVQAAREAARRMQCNNNLKQIGLAVINYHDTYRMFPFSQAGDYNELFPGSLAAWGPDWSENSRSWSFLSRILPFIEQQNLYDMGAISTAHLIQSPAVGQSIPGFLCPSDPGTGEGSRSFRSQYMYRTAPPQPVGLSNYKGVMGDSMYGIRAVFPPRFHNWADEDPWCCGNGIFTGMGYYNQVRMSSILDGTSNTFLVGEDAWYSAPNSHIGYGYSWAHAYDVLATAAVRPNNRRLPPLDVNEWQQLNGFKSRHPGGVSFALADGSCRFISDSIDLFVYRGMATKDGGEVVSEP